MYKTTRYSNYHHSLIFHNNALIGIALLFFAILYHFSGLTKLIVFATFIKLSLVNNFFHHTFVDIVTKLLKVALAHFLLLFHESFDVVETVKFCIHFSLDIGVNIQHHSNHDV